MTDVSLRKQATSGAAWSGVSTIVLRLGSLMVGIVLARLLTPEQFGVFAVALTVQSILMTVADLGLSSDLVRAEDPDRIAPTIASLGLLSGSLTALVTIASSGWLASTMGAAEAAPAIATLAVTLFLAGVSVVPYAYMLRRFQQRELFWVGVVDFIVYTAVTLTLVALGFGVMGLALGRVAAQMVASTLQFVFARMRPRYGIARDQIRPILAYSLPIACANLLAWALLNVDNVVLARLAGATALGYYVLAFNVSSWPMTALSQVVRSISLPYFSRVDDPAVGVERVSSLGWALALPASGMIAVLSAPIISVLYGENWLPAAPALAVLGVYGAVRVIFDVATGYLYARGRSRPVLWIQLGWLVSMVIGMVAVVPVWGILGAAAVHVVTGVGLILPAYLGVLSRSGVPIKRFLYAHLPPTLATVPAVIAAWGATFVGGGAATALLLGGLVGVLVYAAAVWPWLRRRLRHSPGGS